MRFMVIVKATAESEKEGALPDPQLLLEMGKYNEELIKAGVLLAMDGLHPSSKGARVKILRQVSYRHRRPLHRVQGARRRLLALAGQVPRRGHRVGQARPQVQRRRLRNRNPPG